MKTATRLLIVLSTAIAISAGEIRWQHLTTKQGDLEIPGPSTQQTGAIVADFDRDGINDFVLSFREKPPALVWYRRHASGWSRVVIEPEYLAIEAGGAVFDIDGDGDLDLVFGGDYQSDELWWWENPCPNFEASQPWKRHIIKKGGGRQHHDQVFGDFLGTGRPQLAFWNQGAKTLFLAEIPADVRRAPAWIFHSIYSAKPAEGGTPYAEGLAAADIDADGKIDLLAGNCWFKHEGNWKFKPIRVGSIGGRIAAGKLKPGRFPQVVIAPGDGTGPLAWYDCQADPLKSADWQRHELLPRVVHGHSLQLGDIDGDGALDIFCAEMAKWTERRNDPDYPAAKAWIFYGNGQGQFRQSEFATGYGFHEAQVADLDGDGDLDILDKPYNWEAPRIDVWLNNGTSTTAKKLK